MGEHEARRNVRKIEERDGGERLRRGQRGSANCRWLTSAPRRRKLTSFTFLQSQPHPTLPTLPTGPS
jgi:hypothetical protein